MRNTRVITRLVGAVLCLVAVGACTHGPGRPPRTTTTLPPPDARNVLIEYKASGGMCPDAMCGAKVTILRNGAYHLTSGSRESDGQLDAATARDLTQRVDSQLSTLFHLPPGPELCPSAYDGSDITIMFSGQGEDNFVRVTNCDPTDHSRNVAIPGTNPLMQYSTQLIAGLLYPAPAPSKLLVEYHESGGRCREMCPVENATIGADGAWNATSGATATSGQLDKATLDELTRRIRAGAAGLTGLPPSTGCPSAYDGRDITITFSVDGRTVAVSNCDKRIAGNPLVDYTTQLVNTFF